MTIKKFNITLDKFKEVIPHLQNGSISKFGSSGVLLYFLITGPKSKIFIHNLEEMKAIKDKTLIIKEYILYNDLDIGLVNNIPFIGRKGDIVNMELNNSDIIIFNCIL